VKYVTKFAASETLQRSERVLNVAGAIVYDLAQATSVRAAKILYRALSERASQPRLSGALRAIAQDPAPVLAAAARFFLAHQPALDISGTPILGVGCEQVPNFDSRLKLIDDRDVLGVRRAALDWRLTDLELRSCARFAEVAAAELERLGIGSVELTNFNLPADPEQVSGVAIDAGHHMGTTRMSAGVSSGVVDSTCQVFGLENLYIGSCSVFPTSGSTNPTFTLIALCLRLADTLKARASSQAVTKMHKL
jgi:choline dehydrogenase-like flavoprotein